MPASGSSDYFDEFVKAPWKASLGFNEQDLERHRAQQAIERLTEVLAQERTVVRRVASSESRTTDSEGKMLIRFKEESIRLTFEIEWSEWHPLPDRGDDSE